ncbi:RIO1-domain-containing protein [Multifurca ochricompacta]|uniref:Serine/threonine-protein kinase RIO1 n=1 Tax=Multifurca ochricompacta TaxID=376703 RepID=A0AAD4M7A0_9AGAM|nr:RIO1-domain-containing protein [Multifurca ochricompacta]
MPSPLPVIENGQFDDPPTEGHPYNSREGYNFIDDTALEQFDHESEEDDDDDDLLSNALDDGLARVEDEDWEISERDFTKQYNRLRQHLAVSSGNAQGVASSIRQTTSVASLPAVNRPKAVTDSRLSASGQLLALAKYSSRLARINVPYMMGAGVNRKGPSSYANMKDKSDRATNEQVLDPRTRIILFKMIGRGLIHEVNGCVSTGKEANVYHALTPDSAHLALKIYKTSILVFKDRDRYVTGEYRFRRGYNRKNPRKMVRLWAEKELRNLRRLRAAEIPCPEPLEVRENVLVMSFLGDNEGWASPRLKDAEIADRSTYAALYSELVLNLRKLFHQCKLVHADLSEYNILYHRGHLYIIDVSQSVEHDHPSAFDFLRNDIKNIEDFFSRTGVNCLGLRRCFEFIVKEKLETTDGLNEEDVLKKWLEFTPSEGSSEGGPIKAVVEQAAHEDAVFKKSHIPRTLGELYDPEREVAALSLNDWEKPIYADTIELVHPDEKNPTEGDDTQSNDSGELRALSRSSDTAGEGSEPFEDKRSRGHRHEDRELKKERKKATKVEQREKRKSKMPKAEKKKRIKASR